VFFSVATEPDQRFDNHVCHQGLWISFDPGWQVTPHSISKGYVSNSCELLLTDQGIKITHSEPRSFPLWFDHGSITNLRPGSGRQAWASDHLHMNLDGTVVWTPNPLDLSVPDSVLTLSQARSRIREILDHAVLECTGRAVKLFCSGGLDTFLLYSLLHRHGCDVELLKANHWDDNSFVERNKDTLSSHWSYSDQQLHHWNRPTWLATGGCGDEYFLRGPAVIAMFTAWHGIDFWTLLNQHPDQYHYRHFAKYQDLWQQTWQQRHKLQQQFPTRQDLNRQIMNVLCNDHQHWHLGETTTWTPFKNIELVRILLQCDAQDLVPQFLHGQFTRDIIADYCAPVLEFVSTYKNHNSNEKLTEFWSWHAKNAG
jgi:hypothetical protein